MYLKLNSCLLLTALSQTCFSFKKNLKHFSFKKILTPHCRLPPLPPNSLKCGGLNESNHFEISFVFTYKLLFPYLRVQKMDTHG